jgi:hypothetical protein
MGTINVIWISDNSNQSKMELFFFLLNTFIFFSRNKNINQLNMGLLMPVPRLRYYTYDYLQFQKRLSEITLPLTARKSGAYYAIHSKIVRLNILFYLL